MSSRYLSEMDNVVHKFGSATLTAAGGDEILWSGLGLGGTETPHPAAAVATEIVSTDDNDGKTGAPSASGARTVFIDGIDGSGARVTETVTLDGTTAVTSLANDYLRINRASVASAGTGLTNAGAISIRHTTGPVVIGYIAAGVGQTETCAFTVPVGKQLQFTYLSVSSTVSTTVKAKLWHKDLNGVTRISATLSNAGSGMPLVMPESMPLVYAATEDVWITVDVGNNGSGSGFWVGKLEYANEV